MSARAGAAGLLVGSGVGANLHRQVIHLRQPLDLWPRGASCTANQPQNARASREIQRIAHTEL